MKKSPKPHPAIESKANGSIPLDPQQAGILQTLLAEQQAVEEKIAYFIQECASKKGVNLDSHALNLRTMTFIPKPPQPAASAVVAK